MLDYINENLLSHGIAIEGLKYIPQEEPRDYLLGIVSYHKGKRWLPCLFFWSGILSKTSKGEAISALGEELSLIAMG